MTMMMMILSMTFSGLCHDYAFRNRYRCHGLLPHLVNICTRALADGHAVVAALHERPHLWPLLGWMPRRGAVQTRLISTASSVVAPHRTLVHGLTPKTSPCKNYQLHPRAGNRSLRAVASPCRHRSAL